MQKRYTLPTSRRATFELLACGILAPFVAIVAAIALLGFMR